MAELNQEEVAGLHLAQYLVETVAGDETLGGLATLGGVVLCFTPADPVKELFWSAVINGVIAVPIMAAMMVVASRRQEMGAFVATPGQKLGGWVATAVMAAAAVAMFALQ